MKPTRKPRAKRVEAVKVLGYEDGHGLYTEWQNVRCRQVTLRIMRESDYRRLLRQSKGRTK